MARDEHRPSREQGPRARRSGVKVGGHQASSASMVSIMTALYFDHLRAADRVSVKPHASPVLHAIEYLLGPARPRLPDRAARVRRAAELSEPRQGPDPGRLLDRVGRDRRDRADLERARPPLRRRPLRRAARRPAGRAASATPSSTRARSGRRSSIRWSRASARCCGSSTSTASRSIGSCPTSRPGGSAAMFEAAGWQTITVKYGRRLRELFARAGRRGAAPADRRDAQRGVPAPAARRRRRRARAPARRRPRRGATLARLIADLDDGELARAIRDLGGHDLGDLLDAFARGRRGARPAVGDLRLHDQGVAAADRGPSRPTTRRCCRPSSGRSWRATLGADADDPWARLRRGRAGGRAVRARPPSGCARPSTARRRPAGGARRGRARAHAARASTQQAFGRFFVDLAHDAPEVAAHVVTVSPDVASSTNLGGWINRVGRLAPRRAHRLVRRRHRHARALARERARPAHRARDRRGQPRRPARRAGRDLVARRPAAAADRHALRPVRQPRARAVVVRDLRRRPVDPRRHALGRHARAGGRRPPVDHHAVGRARAAAAASPGSRRSARTSSGRCCTRSAGSAGPTAVRVLPADDPPARPGARRGPRATRPRASGAAEQVLAGGYLLRRAAGAPGGDARRRRRGDARGARGRRRAGRPPAIACRRRLPDLAPTSSSGRCRRAQGLRRRRRRDPRRRCSRPSGRRRSSPCSTAIRTRSRSSAAIARRADRLPRRRRLRPVRRHRGPLPPLRDRRRHDRRRRHSTSLE